MIVKFTHFIFCLTVIYWEDSEKLKPMGNGTMRSEGRPSIGKPIRVLMAFHGGTQEEEVGRCHSTM